MYGPEERIDQARMMLATEFVFFASVFFRLSIEVDPTCKTAWTDGRSIGYNQDWLGQWTVPQICGVFIHEVLHVVLKHNLREEITAVFGQNHRKWNRACDYALNPTVLACKGVELPPGCLLDMAKWPDDLAEDIFNQLPDDFHNDTCFGGPGKPDTNGEGVDMGEVRPLPGSGKDGKATKAEKAEAANEVDQWIKAAGMKASGMGRMDGDTDRLIKKATAPMVYWQDELQLMVECISKDDYTFKRPNTRFMQQGIYLPSLHGQHMPDLLFYVDVSGSLHDDQLAQIMGEARAIIEQFNVRVIVVYWNTKYVYHEEFLPEDILDPSFSLNIKGGSGGTAFGKCWEWIDEQDDIVPEGIVFFTDIETSDWPMEHPGVDVIWAQVSNSGRYSDNYHTYMPDYGKRVKIPYVAAGGAA
jgi:predicted metal-dependent peptidase